MRYDITNEDLHQVREELETLCYEIIQPDGVPITVSLSANAGFYIVKQLQRLEQTEVLDDLDLAAYYSRNIFEAVLMLEYTVRHAPKLDPKQVVLEMMQDRLDVIDGAISLFGEHPTLREELEGSKLSIISKLANGGSKPARTPRVSQLAQLVGAKSEYAGLYKLYSKYTHPSAYLLYSSKSGEEAAASMSVFRYRSYVYAHQAINTYREVRELFGELYDTTKIPTE